MLMKKTPIAKKYVSEEQYRKRLYAMGRKDAYSMPTDEVFRIFERPAQPNKYGTLSSFKPKQPVNPQKTLDDFEIGKVSRAAFLPINPRTVSSCKRYYEAGIAGEECKMVLQQAQQYERAVGREIYGIDEQKLSIYSVLPRVSFGLSERNIIYIKNWYMLNDQDRKILSQFFDYRGVAYPGKSGEFIKNFLPKGRQEKRMFETFNLIHGLNIEISPEGFVYIKDYQDLDPDMKDLLEFYFTEDGYAKAYFQNTFMNRLGIKFREHIPSKIKTREQLISSFRKASELQLSSEDAEKLLLKKNPSIKTDIRKFDADLANDLVNRYRVYSRLSSFLNEDLAFIGSTSYADEMFDLTEEFESKSEVISTTFYRKEKFGIAISDPYAVNSNKLKWFLSEASKTKWIPEGCINVDYFTAHEFAHGLIHVYDLSRDPILRGYELDTIEKGNIVNELSMNAKMNTKEFIADAWSEYVLSDSPRELSMKVGDRILNFLQKKVMVL